MNIFEGALYTKPLPDPKTCWSFLIRTENPKARGSFLLDRDFISPNLIFALLAVHNWTKYHPGAMIGRNSGPHKMILRTIKSAFELFLNFLTTSMRDLLRFKICRFPGELVMLPQNPYSIAWDTSSRSLPVRKWMRGYIPEVSIIRLLVVRAG